MHFRSPLRYGQPSNAGREVSHFNITTNSQALRDRNDLADASYVKETVSQYSTNHTQMKESLRIELPDEDMYPARPNESTLNFRLAPSTPTKTRNYSPMSRTPTGNQGYVPRSPGLSPISKSPMLNKTGGSFIQELSSFPHLEHQGLSMEEIRQEKSINGEMLKSARSLCEITKLLKNSLQLLKRDVPGAGNMVMQALSKSESHKIEVEDCKRRLREVHSIAL